MRVTWVVVGMLVFGACATSTQGVDRARRWPSHRKETDRRFADLERRADALETQNATLAAKNSELAARLEYLERWIANNAKRAPDSASAPSAAPPDAAP